MSVRKCGAIWILETFDYLMQPYRYIWEIVFCRTQSGQRLTLMTKFVFVSIQFVKYSSSYLLPVSYFPMYPTVQFYHFDQLASTVRLLPWLSKHSFGKSFAPCESESTSVCDSFCCLARTIPTNDRCTHTVNAAGRNECIGELNCQIKFVRHIPTKPSQYESIG